MIVVRAKRSVALGTLALSSFVSRLEAFQAENVEALGQNSVFLLDLARRTSQFFFVFSNLFH